MTFEGYIVGSTGRAILFHCHYWNEPDWMPRSQIDVLREEDTHEVRVVASRWIADQKELREFQYREKPQENLNDP